VAQALLGMSALVEAGLFLHKILLEDVTISPYNGQVKIGEQSKFVAAPSHHF
jgi:hypothetical protein